MTLTGLLLTLIPLALLLAVVATLRRRGPRVPLRRWLAWWRPPAVSAACCCWPSRGGGISGVDRGQAALVALGSLTLGSRSTPLIYARARSGGV